MPEDAVYPNMVGVVLGSRKKRFANVRAEWAIVCTVHNLLKLAAAKLAQRWSLSAALPLALAAR